MNIIWQYCDILFQYFSSLVKWNIFARRSMIAGLVRWSCPWSNGCQSTDTLVYTLNFFPSVLCISSSYTFNKLFLSFESIPNYQHWWNQRSKIKYGINKNTNDNPWYYMSLYSFLGRFEIHRFLALKVDVIAWEPESISKPAWNDISASVKIANWLVKLI